MSNQNSNTIPLPNLANGGKPSPDIIEMYKEIEIFEDAIREIYAHIATAICINPDSVNELNIQSLVLIRTKLYSLLVEDSELHPEIIWRAATVLAHRVSELEHKTGVDFREKPPKLEQVETWQREFREDSEEFMEELKEAPYYWIPTLS
jgi:hypothetical protein